MKRFWVQNQICRAAISISNNIAEGFDRSSNPDFRRFLYFSLASNSEVKSMLYLAHRLEYINESDKHAMLNYSNEIGKILNGLINSITPKKP
ncbi:MAG: four helix bundle protein [Saprospiraceae bacterium]|nr:four helix bundle protein [Saprospiraceae bacterium]